MNKVKVYCPVCGRDILAVDLLTGEYIDVDNKSEEIRPIYLHDDIDHQEDDIEALQYGIN